MRYTLDDEVQVNLSYGANQYNYTIYDSVLSAMPRTAMKETTYDFEVFTEFTQPRSAADSALVSIGLRMGFFQ